MEATSLYTVTTIDFDPFAGPELLYVAPSTEPQREVWTACQLGGDDANRAYNESISLRFTGALDAHKMEEALRALLNRHEALRSAFSADGKQLCIFKEIPLDLRLLDFSADTPEVASEQVAAYVNEDALFRFDLLRGPLFKAGLLKVSTQTHYLVLTAHHIICDGWSMGVIMQDLGKLYSDYVQNRVSTLASAPTFRQYAEEQRRLVADKTHKQTEAYWVDQYKANVPVVDLPTDFNRPALRTYTSDRLDYTLDRSLVTQLKTLGVQAGCSFVTTLLSAFMVFLHRLTNQEDLIVGLPAAGQSDTGHYRLVGHCVNLLPIQSRFLGSRSFAEFLNVHKNTIYDAYEHQQLTFGSLLKALKIPRDASRVPLVPVVFNIDMGVSDGVHFAGLDFQLISNPRAFENFELFLNATGSEKDLTLEWSYNTQLFKATTIDRFMTGFEELLREIVAAPSLPLNHLATSWQSLPDAIEPADLVTSTAHRTIIDLFEEQVRKTPENIAVSDNSQRITYRELNTKANQLAHYLRKRGVREETLVPMCISRSLEMIIGILGILKAGGAYVPIDPDYPEERIQFMLADTASGLIITDTIGAARLTSLEKDVDIVRLDSDWSAIQLEPTEAPLIAVTARTLAYVIYTSGSTGRPKGVLSEHTNVVSLFEASAHIFNFSATDVWTMFHSYCFDFSVWEMYGALFYGGRVVIVPSLVAKDARLFGKLLKDEGVTVLSQTPSHFYMLSDYLLGKLETLPLRYVILGGEALNPGKLRPWKKVYENCQLINIYGPTETTIYVTCQEMDWPQIQSNRSVIGKPIPNLAAYVLDGQQQKLPVGVMGELYIAGAGLARGYLNRPELTAERFIDNPFSNQPGSKLYRTGDLAKWLPDGTLEYLGRIDEQVKIRGYRIELGEIESVLLQCPGVRHSVVVAKERVGGDKRLVAYVVTEGDFNKPEIIRFLQSKLPEYMIPQLIMPLPAIPLTSNGKVDKKQLPNPDMTESVDNDFAAPANATEALLVRIWSDLLQVETVSTTANFFELGGHSLIAIRFVTLLEKETGKQLPISTLFEYPTIQKVALLIDQKRKVKSWKSLVAIKASGQKIPIYIVHGGGLNVLNFSSMVSHLDPEQPVYGFQALGLDGIDKPLEDMQAIASFYVNELLEQNPEGPYVLAGYSFGGYIAVEMARLLKEMSKPVKMLALFDTEAEMSSFQRLLVETPRRKVIKQFWKLFWLTRSLVNEPVKTIDYQIRHAKRQLNNIKASLDSANKQSESEGALQLIDQINYKHEQALGRYVLKPYEGGVHVFKATNRPYFYGDYQDLGWKRYALGGVSVFDVPGTHLSMFTPPYDQEFARVLQNALDTCSG
ncbi:amino acid adenylation domain-containing protein [Spirosoma taeanense]|uniref:Amino acid adenylation domain-containing protein n=1 Tax=Spirosoma taeanense TaxID=2735870 RepID=A0A6M5XZK5_9BACT|nr:non-ribosomal peptide synthetase [Spirosoma taeanense]QJW88007.1 amino acid adenylation domain-containing protein [Spirosoma taeanense]